MIPGVVGEYFRETGFVSDIYGSGENIWPGWQRCFIGGVMNIWSWKASCALFLFHRNHFSHYSHELVCACPCHKGCCFPAFAWRPVTQGLAVLIPLCFLKQQSCENLFYPLFSLFLHSFYLKSDVSKQLRSSDKFSHFFFHTLFSFHPRWPWIGYICPCHVHH